MSQLRRGLSVYVVVGGLLASSAAASPFDAIAGAAKGATTSSTTTGTTAPAAGSGSPVRIVASSQAVTDAAGRVYQPDAPYAVGGKLLTTTAGIDHTYTAALYQHYRAGVTGYHVPVNAPGTYFVDLYVAETQDKLAGQRVWSVTAEGRSVATNVDVARDAGQDRAWHVMFSAPVVDGSLDLALTASVGTPSVSAVEVYQQSTNTTPTTTFSDEFTGAANSSPDPSRWLFDRGGSGWGNNELETYTDRPSNVSLDGAGNLRITARREVYTGDDGITRDYTSGRIFSGPKVQYGTVTTRMRVPTTQGLLPAFWLLGANFSTAGWPGCGEIDVMENVGYEPNTVHATVHGTTSGSGTWLSGAAATVSGSVSDAYHVFKLTWGPNGITIAMDGRTFFAVAASDQAAGTFWNFNHTFSVLLNVAVGGSWPGSPDTSTVLPATLSVDYVRVQS